MLATAVVVAGLGVALGVVLSNGSSGGGSQDVALQPVAAAGPEPFTDSVAYASGSAGGGSGQASSTGGAGSPTAAAPSAAGGTVNGDEPGLYGGTREVASCDVPKLSGYLTGNADKARAWAGVEGIDSSQIDGYLHGLTPVVLRQDTRVTNHGYHNGQATAYQAVLQSGTAVLVDNQGVPRVRCACGNPLLPPNGTGGTYTGTAWTSFQVNSVVTVKPAAAPVTQIVLVDQATGSQFDRPVGGTGNTDSSAKPSASGSASSKTGPGSGSPSGASPSGSSSGAPSSGGSGPSGKSSPGPGSASSSGSAGASGQGSSGTSGAGGGASGGGSAAGSGSP